MRNIFVFVILAAALASCVSKEKLVARGWKFKDANLGVAKDSANGAFLEMARQQMITNLTISMDMDSSYSIRQLKEGAVIRGKWWFSADKKHIFFKTDHGLNQADILMLNSKTLVYTITDKAGQVAKMTFVPTEPKGSK